MKKKLAVFMLLAAAGQAQSMMGLMAAAGSGASGIVPKDTGNALCTIGGADAVISATFTGHFFYVYASSHPASLPLTISDDLGNTANYVALTPTSALTAPNGHSWFLRNATPGAGAITVHSAGGLLTSACVVTFDGVATTGAVDQENHNAGQTGTGCQAGSITPGANNSLVVVGLNYEVTVSVTSLTNATLAGNKDGVGGTGYGVGVGYVVQTTATAVDPAWLVSPTSTKDCSIASFQ